MDVLNIEAMHTNLKKGRCKFRKRHLPESVLDTAAVVLDTEAVAEVAVVPKAFEGRSCDSRRQLCPLHLAHSLLLACRDVVAVKLQTRNTSINNVTSINK